MTLSISLCDLVDYWNIYYSIFAHVRMYLQNSGIRCWPLIYALSFYKFHRFSFFYILRDTGQKTGTHKLCHDMNPSGYTFTFTLVLRIILLQKRFFFWNLDIYLRNSRNLWFFVKNLFVCLFVFFTPQNNENLFFSLKCCSFIPKLNTEKQFQTEQ